MISRDNQTLERKSVEESINKVAKITFPPVSSINSSYPVIIKVRIFERQVNRVYMDSRSSREVIYEHCFLKLKPSIRCDRVLTHERDTKTLYCKVFPSPHNLLLVRTSMQRMGIVVSTIHGAIKFHTTRGIGTVFSTHEIDKEIEEQKKLKGNSQKTPKGILSCVEAKETIAVDKKYPEQTIVIGKQLSTIFKMKL
ncbi:hypothetical protein Tco_0298580 [Tanacetum coccineum]